jgi:hypothetical protein
VSDELCPVSMHHGDVKLVALGLVGLIEEISQLFLVDQRRQSSVVAGPVVVLELLPDTYEKVSPGRLEVRKRAGLYFR